MTRLSARSTHIDFATKHDTSYCIPIWLRDEQIKVAITKVKERIEAVEGTRDEPIAIAGFGPSLKETWEKIREFKYVISCSGSHRFLIDRGIIPTWHVAVDPLPKNTVQLIGAPHPDVEYLIASTCHPDVLDHLKGFKVKLWHVFSNEAEALRTLPPNEWALTGGPDVGLRAMAIARFFGFNQQHVFGIDGCAGPSDASHADAHPKSPKNYLNCEYPEGSGRMWRTTPALLECAKAMPHELNMLKDVKATFYGDTLVRAIAEGHKLDPNKSSIIGIIKPELITSEYRDLNRKLHRDNLAYGVGGGKYSDIVLQLVDKCESRSVLDYGCGKGYLGKALPFPIWEYDPAIEGKEEPPRPAEIVVCFDVLEHIERDKILFVLEDLKRCVLKVGYFIVHTGPSSKTLADGRNAHILQEGNQWWLNRMKAFFAVAKVIETPPLLHFVVCPKGKPEKLTAPEMTEITDSVMLSVKEGIAA